MTDDPFAARRRDGFTTLRATTEPVAGRYDELAAATSESKAKQVEQILTAWGDMHSHYVIDARNGGFAIVRTFEIDDAMLGEYRLPDEQELYWRPTLDELHDSIIESVRPGNSRWTDTLREAAGIVQRVGIRQSH